MSAYICDDETISAIAKAFVDYGVMFDAKDYKPTTSWFIDVNELRKEIAQSLLNQNYESVNYRYGEDTPTPPVNYIDVVIDEGIVYGCIKNYEYQSCETDDWYGSRIRFSLKQLERKILERCLNKLGMKVPYGYGSDIDCLWS